MTRTASRYFRRVAVLPLLALLFALWMPAPAQAQHIVLSDLVLDNHAGNVMVRFSLALDDEREIEQVLIDGARLALVCRASLSDASGLLFDSTVTEARYVNRLSYDSLSKEFYLERSGGDPPVRGRDLASLLKEYWSVIEIDLGAFEALERGNDYALDLDVELKYDDVPKWLRRTLFFWSWSVAPSASYRMEFEY